MDSLLPLAVKDQCPEAVVFRGTKCYSLMIPLSQFQTNELKQEGPTGFLSTLRKQYPDGTSISFHKMKLDSNKQNKEEEVVEISFETEDFRENALFGPFLFDGRTINVYKSLEPEPGFLYQVRIDTNALSSLPESYQKSIMGRLDSYGAVQNIHWHYTEDGNWFIGEGYGFLDSFSDCGPEVGPIQAEGYSFKLTACPCYDRV